MVTYEQNELKVNLGSYFVDIGYQLPMMEGSDEFIRLCSLLKTKNLELAELITNFTSLINSFKDADEDLEIWLKTNEIAYSRWFWVDRN